MTEPTSTALQLPAELRDRLPRRIAHALRTPLGLVNAALQELDASADDEPLLALGRRGARQLARLADRLSLLGRLAQGDAGQQGPIELVELVGQAMEDVADTRPRRAVQMSRGPMPARAVVSGDPDHLRAALTELVDNAMRFAKRSVEVRVHVRDAVVVVEIHDDGPGPSATAEASSTRAGLGLGLHLVRSIAAVHQGHASLDDDPQGGALASLSLRAAD